MFELTLHYLVLIKQIGSVETGVTYLKDNVSTLEDCIIRFTFSAESY
jgi:hypothetical protein